MDYRPGKEALEDQTPSRMNAKTCQVCGVAMPAFEIVNGRCGRARRYDAKTCGPTCRKRLQRGTLARDFKNGRKGWPLSQITSL